MGENDRPRCQAHPRGGVFFRAAHFPCFQKVLYAQGGLQPLVQSFHEGRPREGTAEKDPRKAGRQRNAFIAARLPFQAEAVPTSSGGDIDPVVLFQQRGESGDLMIEEEAVFLIRKLQPDIFEENGTVEGIPQGPPDVAAPFVHINGVFFVRQAQSTGKTADPRPYHGDPALLRRQVVAVRPGVRRIGEGRLFKQVQRDGGVHPAPGAGVLAGLVAQGGSDGRETHRVGEKAEGRIEGAPLHPSDKFPDVETERAGRSAERVFLLQAAVLDVPDSFFHLDPVTPGPSGNRSRRERTGRRQKHGDCTCAGAQGRGCPHPGTPWRSA